MTARGALANDKKSGREGIGRSRGGLTTKIHLAADLRCRPIARLTSPGQDGDSPYFTPLMDAICIRRPRRSGAALQGHMRGVESCRTRTCDLARGAAGNVMPMQEKAAPEIRRQNWQFCAAWRWRTRHRKAAHTRQRSVRLTSPPSAYRLGG